MARATVTVRPAKPKRGTRNGQLPGTATPKIVHEGPVSGGSPTLYSFIREWQAWTEPPICTSASGGFRVEVRFEGQSLWLVVQWPSAARLVCLAAFCPGGASVQDQRLNEDVLELFLKSIVGAHHVKIHISGKQRLIHWTHTLVPFKRLRMPYWPCDLYPADKQWNPLETRGVVHTKQKGPRGGFVFGTITRPEPGSFLYLQNLTALNDYFAQTKSSPADRISDQWPELGFLLPPSGEGSLQEDQPVVISDAFLMLSAEAPENELESTQLFLELLADLYPEYPRPISVHRDWPRRVDETIHDLAHSPACTTEHDGHRYLRAYVGDDETPPESMVQLAVLLPLLEYSKRRGIKIPLAAELQANIPTFFNPKIGTVGRWLPTQEHLLNAKEEHLKPNVMDSWYLFHTFLNLARLSEFGDRKARELFLESLRYGIKVAHHFNYRWPVLYDLYTLEPVRLQDGEGDVAAQYIHVMQQAYEMTGDGEYIAEAECAARTLTGLGFELGYQYNNTAFGAGALMWLWKETGKELYHELSTVCLAAIAQNLWLWQSRFGWGQHYQTFMALPPLRTAPYLALYEELEMLAAFHEYFAIAGDDALPAARVLLPEFCKYLIDRAWQHYPSEIPKDMLAEKIKTGLLDRNLSIPVEDMYAGWEKCGQVGQQVYGAAAPFVFATRHSHLVPGEDFSVNCDVPIRNKSLRQNRRSRTGQMSFQAEGDRRCQCHVRIVAQNFKPLPEVRLVRTDMRKEVQGLLTRFGYLEYELPANAAVRVHWKSKSTKRRHGAL